MNSEFLNILKDRKLLIAISAIIIIPILYAGMFLWAFWDPYEQLVDLPIAVVNEDVGVYEDGELLELGNELAYKLGEEGDFDFHFVTKEAGYTGLEKEDYYILIEIPNDFSKNSLTLMDEHPKKAELLYIPNESYNFLASQIGETAMLQIEVALQEKISETYAKTIFDKITEVADGLTVVSEATVELYDGAVELQDGAVTISESMQTLVEKSLEFSDGINEVAAGTASLKTGAEALSDGLNQLEDASGQLFGASGDVAKGTIDLNSGITSFNEGIKSVQKNIPTLITGTSEVKEGLSAFQKQLPIEMADEIEGQILLSAEEMNAGLEQLEMEISRGLTKELVNGLANGLAAQISVDQTVLMETLLQNGVDPAIIQAIAKDAQTPEELVASLQPQISGAIKQSIDKIGDGFTTYSQAVNRNLIQAAGGFETAIETAIRPTFEKLIDGVTEINEGQIALQAGVLELAAGTNELQAGAGNLAVGQAEYVDNFSLFTAKMNDATNGVATLASGSISLQDGMSELQDGTVQLNDGSEKLADGASELTDGMGTLVEGTDEFKTEMRSAADEAADINTNEATIEMFASPVEVKNEKINNVPNYGTGFAPYFLSLGLFVGALLLSIVSPLRDPAGIPKNAFQWFYSKVAVIFAVGVFQALVASGVLLLVLGLEVQSVPLFLLFSIITSLVFVTLIQFLVTCFADSGRFVAILILIMQLTTSAGTFPLELIPKALQPLNFLLPMTYSVSGFKAVVSSGDYGVMWQNAGILIGFAIVFMLLTYSYFVVMFKRKFGMNSDKQAVALIS